MRRFRVCVLVCTIVLSLAACGADDDVKVDAQGDPSSTDATTPIDPVLAEIESRGEPTPDIPEAPATELEIIDDIEGTGDPVPEGSTVTVHYLGIGQASGEQFDSSWERGEPATFPLASVIPGWSQGIVGMKVGGRRTLIIPGELAYGTNPPSDAIGADETLVFTVDLVSFVAPPAAPEPCVGSTPGSTSEGGADVLAEITARGKPEVTVPDAPATELCYIDAIVGAGAEVPATASVTVHYVGVGQASGQEFDSSWERGETATFSLSGVIKGWTLGIPGMKVGGRRTLIIPGELVHGASPPSADIGANETLVFTIDLVSIG